MTRLAYVIGLSGSGRAEIEIINLRPWGCYPKAWFLAHVAEGVEVRTGDLVRVKVEEGKALIVGQYKLALLTAILAVFAAVYVLTWFALDESSLIFSVLVPMAVVTAMLGRMYFFRQYKMKS